MIRKAFVVAAYFAAGWRPNAICADVIDGSLPMPALWYVIRNRMTFRLEGGHR